MNIGKNYDIFINEYEYLPLVDEVYGGSPHSFGMNYSHEKKRADNGLVFFMFFFDENVSTKNSLVVVEPSDTFFEELRLFFDNPPPHCEVDLDRSECLGGLKSFLTF